MLPLTILSGGDDPRNRVVVDAEVGCNTVQRRSLSAGGEDRRDHYCGLRGDTRIDQGLCKCGVVPPAAC